MITDEQRIQEFLSGATVRDAVIFGLVQKADLNDALYAVLHPEFQAGEYLPDAKLLVTWLKDNTEPTIADIAAWMSQNFDIPVLDRKLQKLATQVYNVVYWQMVPE